MILDCLLSEIPLSHPQVINSVPSLAYLCKTHVFVPWNVSSTLATADIVKEIEGDKTFSRSKS